jgi:hypothetical protein
MNLVVSQFPYCPKTDRLGRKMIAVIPVKTYWTFVVRAIIAVSRFRPTDRQKEYQEWKLPSTLKQQA